MCLIFSIKIIKVLIQYNYNSDLVKLLIKFKLNKNKNKNGVKPIS